jgi:hypothetical protein
MTYNVIRKNNKNIILKVLTDTINLNLKVGICWVVQNGVVQNGVVHIKIWLLMTFNLWDIFKKYNR